MKRKIAIIAAASLLTTATIVTATTVNNGRKPANGKAVKTAVAKEKKSNCARTHCFD